jgi:hypothetical protein
MTELDRKINELAFNLGMSRQHKKLVKQLIVEFTQDWYHKGYHEGYDDALEDNKVRPRWTGMKEKAE